MPLPVPWLEAYLGELETSCNACVRSRFNGTNAEQGVMTGYLAQGENNPETLRLLPVHLPAF